MPQTKRSPFAVLLFLSLFLSGLTGPSLGASASAPRYIPAAGAALLDISTDSAGEIVAGLLPADTDQVLPVDGSTVQVSGTDAFPALLRAINILDEVGLANDDTANPRTVQIELAEAIFPEAATATLGSSESAELIITAASSTAGSTADSTNSPEVLLGTAPEAPQSLTLTAGQEIATLWQFTVPGSYQLNFKITLADGSGTALSDGIEARLSVEVESLHPADAALPQSGDAGATSQTNAGAADDLGQNNAHRRSGTGTGTGSEETDEGAGDFNPADHPVLPAGQSPNPAPPSRHKTIVGAVHTDTVSPYLDDGKLILDTSADIDLDGDGVVELHARLKPDQILFHLADAAKTTVPSSPNFSFLGTAGDPIWLAPQVQNPALIWPGFSSEDPALGGKVTGDLQIQLTKVSGPGRVELFMQGGLQQINRTFSSADTLPPWKMSVPQHTHMNWAFSAAGTYVLTFQARGIINGQEQVAANDYTFVVGSLAAHTQNTTTTLTTPNGESGSQNQPTLSATVLPANAVGAVQFRDTTSHQLLGHTPVKNGKADFLAQALNPGEHQIVAEFIPSWATDFKPSISEAVQVSIAGEVVPQPDYADTNPATEADLGSQLPGQAVAITTPKKQLTPGSTLQSVLINAAYAGDWVSVWIPGFNPAWRGWVQTNTTGALTLEVPLSQAVGSYRFIVKDRQGMLVGWDQFTVVASGADTKPGGVKPPAGTGGNTPPPPAEAPAAECAPQVVLETGHIDAFTVSAGGDKVILQIMEDVTGYHVMREVETVLLRIKESAHKTNIPSGTPGSPTGYVLPLSQDPNLIWPGWDTNRTSGSGYSNVSINITNVTGPGTVYIYSFGAFGDLQTILSGGKYAFPGTISVPEPAHTHAEWVFSEKGIYKLTAHAVATNSSGKSIRTVTHTYIFQVGDVPLGDAFCGLASAGVQDAADVNEAVAEFNAAALAEDEAKAAEQAENEARAAAEANRAQNQKDQNTAAAAALPWVEQIDAKLLGLLIGGGVLILAGIAGGTTWYLRRLKKTTPV